MPQTTQTPDTPISIACFEIAAVSLGYKALDAITRRTGIRVLEASVLGPSRFMILCSGETRVLEGLHAPVRGALDGGAAGMFIDHEVIDQIEPQALEGLYALSQVSLNESLVVIECGTVCGLLASAHAMIRSGGLSVIEIKLHRGAGRGGYAFFTGSAEGCLLAAEDARTRLRNSLREGSVEVIDSPAPGFREFFNLSGEA